MTNFDAKMAINKILPSKKYLLACICVTLTFFAVSSSGNLGVSNIKTRPVKEEKKDILPSLSDGQEMTSKLDAFEAFTLPLIDVREDELVYSAVRGDETETKPVIIRNNGTGVLSISDITISTTEFALDPVPTYPLEIGIGESDTVFVKFTPAPVGNGPKEAVMTILNNDATNPAPTVDLYGLALRGITGTNEPPLAQIVQTLGYGIEVGWNTLDHTTDPTPQGEEIIIPLFTKSGSGNVEMIPVARFSPFEKLPFGWYLPSLTNTPVLNEVGVVNGPDSQQLLPTLLSGTTEFDPGDQPFGLFSEANARIGFTEDLLNEAYDADPVNHRVRTYPIKNRQGVPIPNSYLVCFEEATNGDYQDYVFLLRNVKPYEVRINSAGPQYTDLGGKVWIEDDYFSAGQRDLARNFDVIGTNEDQLILRNRFFNNFNYQIPVSGRGPYFVRLYFMEPFFGRSTPPAEAAGKRVFDVDIEGGQGILDDLDIFAEVQHKVLLVKEFSGITVDDGFLSIDFAATADKAIISAIEIISGEATPPALLFKDTPRTVNLQPNTTSTVINTVTTTDLSDQESVTLQATDLATGTTPTWVTLNFAPIDNTVVNSASELPLTFDAAGLAPGTYTARVTGTAAGYTDAEMLLTLNVVDLLPRVLSVDPFDGEVGVDPTSFFVSVNTLSIPDGYELTPTTVNNNNIKLFKVEGNNEIEITANVNDSGGGDAISLTPNSTLEDNTTYIFRLTSGVKANRVSDKSDLIPFEPFESRFTVGTVESTIPGDLSNVEFFQVTDAALGPGINEQFTSLAIGPDQKLYASTVKGTIKRWDVNPTSGVLTNLEELTPVLSNTESRIIIGFVFDEAATAGNLIAYVSHSSGIVTGGGPEWDGKITQLSGPDLSTVKDVVTNLPRSTKDHLINSLATKPGENAIYISSGSNTAGGDPDAAWGFRPERLLAGSIMKLDFDLLPEASWPLNAQTTDNIAVINAAPNNSPLMSDGSYNPYATNSPLTIFSSGIRNAYDLVWHSNGELYVPTNGTAAGGNTPASTDYVNQDPANGVRRIDGTFYNHTDFPVVPQARNVKTQKDWLFRVSQGSYHGHPNPYRGEFVLNHGGATYDGVPGQTTPAVDVDKYPADVVQDPNYRRPAYDFGFSVSANGVIEYKSNAFGGALRGLLMVARFSGPDDIIILQPDQFTKDIANAFVGIPGLGRIDDPLDLVEDPRNGNIYVAQFDRNQEVNKKLILLRPSIPGTGGPEIKVEPELMAMNDPVGGGSVTSTLKISNLGTANLDITNLTFNGGEAGDFSFPNGETALSISPGNSYDLVIAFTAGALGGRNTVLNIENNNLGVAGTITEVPLRGLGTKGLGGNNEPSLQQIVDLYQIGLDIGDDDPTTNVINSNVTQQIAPILGDEINLPVFEKAGLGSVTIEPLGVFGSTTADPILKFGWYINGSPNDTNQVFTIDNTPQSNGQTVDVSEINGILGFDPEDNVFGFYTEWPFFSNRVVYSEDNLNTFANSIPHHVRVYPLKDEAGVIVPDAYVIAFEEHITGFDYQDFVFIARNLRPASNGRLVFASDTLRFETDFGEASPTPQTVNLSQSFGSPQQITLEASVGSFWLNLPPEQVGDLEFNVDVTNLAPGTYTSTVTASTFGFADAELVVILEVKPLELTFSPNTLNFTVVQGQNVAAQNTDLIASQGIPGNVELTRDYRNAWLQLPTNPMAGTLPISIIAGGLAPGNYIDSVKANALGYTEGTLYVNLQVLPVTPNPPTDNIPPVVDVTFSGLELQSGIFKNEVLVRILPTDEGGSGIDTSLFRVNGGAWQPYLNSLLFDEPGVYRVEAQVRDAAGNTSITGAYVFEVIRNELINNKMVLINRDGFPENDELAFSRLQKPWFGSDDFNVEAETHDEVRLIIENRGIGDLRVEDFIMSNPNYWVVKEIDRDPFDPNTMLPFTLGPNQDTELTIQFIAENPPNPRDNGIKVLHETMTIISNDDAAPNKIVKLHGLWQRQAEDVNEPNANEILDAFGLTIDIGFEQTKDGAITTPTGDEIISPNFVRVDRTQPIRALQIAAFHGCCGSFQAPEIFYEANDPANVKGGTMMIPKKHQGSDSQTILPRMFFNNRFRLTAGEFNENRPFNVTINFNPNFNIAPDIVLGDCTNRFLNLNDWVGVRIWRLRNSKGDIVPNSFILANDNLSDDPNPRFPNFDYNDNLMLLTNVRPELGTGYSSELATGNGTPDDPRENQSSLDFGEVELGQQVDIPLSLRSLGIVYPGDNDPDINIEFVEVGGQGRTEFLGQITGKTTLVPHDPGAGQRPDSTQVLVSFIPTEPGFKNAELLIYYNSDDSPKRVPLFGQAKNACQSPVVVKRIKMGLGDTDPVTIANIEWESDVNYYVGAGTNYKLDDFRERTVEQTDKDSLYNLYVSSQVDLQSISYEIPIDNGDYTVRLHFAEMFWSEDNQRVNDISLEGQRRIQALDIFSEVGFRSVYIQDLDVSVTDGSLSIDIDPLINRPSLAAIEIFQVEDIGTLTLTADQITNTSCGTEEGSILVSATGGTNISYRLGRFGDPQTSGLFENLGIGEQTIYAIDTDNGCEISETFVIEATANSIDFDLETQGAGCNAGELGVAAVGNIIGGVAPYTAIWDEIQSTEGLSVEGLAIGTHTVTVTDASGCSATREFEITQEGGCPIRINVNSNAEYIAQDGRIFEADEENQYYTKRANTQGLNRPIQGTDDDEMYRRVRFGRTFGYYIPVTNGRYQVILHFVETFHQEPNKRVFDVSAEGAVILDDYDIFSQVGGRDIAHTEEFTVIVTDGELNLDFARVIDQAIISGIEVIYIGEPEGRITAEQNDLNVIAGGERKDILKVEIDANELIDISTITFNTNGTTDPNAIQRARLFFSGNLESFGGAVEVSNAVNNPGTNNFTFNIDPIITVNRGNYFFWLAYDIDANNANVGDVLDGEVVSAVINGSNYIPDLAAPIGSRTMVNTFGEPGRMLDFDGIDDHVQVPDEAYFDFTNEFTIEAWVRVENFTGTTQSIVTKGNNAWKMQISTNRHLALVLDGIGQVEGVIDVADGEWHHVAATYNGTEVLLCVDGIIDGQANFTGDLANTEAQVQIAGNSEEGGVNFNGQLDEIRIWSVPRSLIEIRESMHLVLDGKETGLVGYWQFNEGSGTLSNDFVNGLRAGLGGSMTNANWMVATEPVGLGEVTRQTVNAPGFYNFNDIGLEITFGAIHPDGELVITRIDNVRPGGVVSAPGFATANSYWIINNYGNVKEGLSDMTWTFDIGNALDVFNGGLTVLHKRPSNGTGAWNEFFIATNVDVASKKVTFEGLTGFSQADVTDNDGSALPIRLLSFQGRRLNDNTVELTWATTLEENNQGFEIERSLDGVDFESIGFVDGAGSSVVRQDYAYLDRDISFGAFYRFKQIDFDGKSSLSPTIYVEGSGIETVSFFPNPTDGQVNFKVSDDLARLKVLKVDVFNSVGKFLFRTKGDVQTLEEEIQRGLANEPGSLYLLKFTSPKRAYILELILQK